MSIRPAALVFVAFMSLGFASHDARAQGQRFKLGGGAGFAWPRQPDISLGSTAAVGGFFGIRFNDNVSVETGFFFQRVNRVFNEDGVPVDDFVAAPAFRFETNRYHLDGTFVYHIGRRQPFHMFVLGGGGIRRRDNKQTDFSYSFDPDTGQIIDVMEDISVDEIDYTAVGHVGAGFDFYFLYNLAARAEYRVWIPTDWDQRTQMIFVAASYFF